MTEPWKPWKTQSGFPTASPAPWESRQGREIPTFPQLRRRLLLLSPKQRNDRKSLTVGGGKVEIQKQDSHFSTTPAACGSKVKKRSEGMPLADARRPVPMRHPQKKTGLSGIEKKGNRPLRGLYFRPLLRINLYGN